MIQGHDQAEAQIQSSSMLHRDWIDLTLEIDTNPDALFALLSDLDGWQGWTPGLVAIWRNKKKEVAVGTHFAMVLAFPVLRRIVLPCQVYVWRPDRLEWGGGFLGARVRHRFELERLPDGRTRLRHVEYATGLLALLFRPFEAFAHRHDRTWSETIQTRFAARRAA
jgi:hypothetical protein